MSFVNYHTSEINCKIVYFGPGLGGKTTNIQYIYQQTTNQSKSKLITLNTENERTLFFDFLPLDIGSFRGMRTRFHLYTVPGQIIYEASRKLILRGVDGIVFVVDSRPERLEANLESLQSLEENMDDLGINLNQLPLVIQYNKRDLPNAAKIDELSRLINKWNAREYEAVASTGEGVFETLKGVTKMVLDNLGIKKPFKKAKLSPGPSL